MDVDVITRPHSNPATAVLVGVKQPVGERLVVGDLLIRPDNLEAADLEVRRLADGNCSRSVELDARGVSGKV
eukprot:1041603-Prymnesium_polylepis.2